ncbi:MAG: glycosyltransferase family 39 protein [Thermodesulfovibrionia bacterium]|nr:glycosyltransferase family 39 protein [Thermodesulfovibrionia bacterium]
MDTSLFFFINNSMQNSFFDLIMPFISNRAYLPFLLIVSYEFFKDRKQTLFVLSLCVLAFALGDSSANILKHIFERPRPCHALEGIRLLTACGSSFSFPSGHSVNSFAIAAVFAHFFRRTAFATFTLAMLVAFSRIYIGAHYPSDVLAGAIWGGVTAWVIIDLQKWFVKGYKEKPAATIFITSLLALTFFRYYYIFTGPLDMSPDEAHYWEWARRLDLSYYSKGPLIAWLIAATTWILGDNLIGVRFLAPVFLGFSSIFLYLLTMDLFAHDEKKHLKSCAAGLLIQLTPLFSAYGILMTIDSPFIFFWTLSLYLFWKAVSSEHGLFVWILLGISIGLGLLTKYTMAFFYICGFFFLFFSKEERRWFSRKEPYIALLVSILVFSPVIIWNAGNDWVTLKHTAGQAHISEGFKISFKYFFDFIGSQLGVISPLIFFMLLYGAAKNRRSFKALQNLRFLFWFWFPVLSFFLIKSLQGKVQANWAMHAYITAFIASADYFINKDMRDKALKILTVSSLVILLIFAVITYYPSLIHLPVKQDPTSRLQGWQELGVKADEIYDDMRSSSERGVFIFSDKYQVSGELAFYMKSHPVTYNANFGRRMNQYDMWEGFETLSGYDAIFISMGNESFPKELEGAFAHYSKEILTVYRRDDKVLREYSIFKCYNFKGLLKKDFESY